MAVPLPPTGMSHTRSGWCRARRKQRGLRGHLREAQLTLSAQSLAGRCGWTPGYPRFCAPELPKGALTPSPCTSDANPAQKRKRHFPKMIHTWLNRETLFKKIVMGREDSSVQLVSIVHLPGCGHPGFVCLAQGWLGIKDEVELSAEGSSNAGGAGGGTASAADPFSRLQSFPIFNIKGIWRETGQNIVFWETSNQTACSYCLLFGLFCEGITWRCKKEREHLIIAFQSWK